MRLRHSGPVIILILSVLLGGCPGGTPEPVYPRPAPTKPAGYRLLVYYGDAWRVNGLNDPEKAGQFFAGWDYLVIEADTVVLQTAHKQNPNLLVFSYIDIGKLSHLDIATIRTQTDKYKRLGTDGIFLDCAGFDFEVSRQRLNAVLDYAHSVGLRTIVNAWNPDDVFASARHPIYNPDGLASSIGPDDFFFCENFLYTDVGGEVDAFRQLTDRAQRLWEYRRQTGTRVLACNTLKFDEMNEAKMLEWHRLIETAAAIWSWDGYGLATPIYSASGQYLNRVARYPFTLDYLSHYDAGVRPRLDASAKLVARGRTGFELHGTPNLWYSSPAYNTSGRAVKGGPWGTP
jgi:hypothetical protein